MTSTMTRSAAVAALALASCGVAAHADLVTNGGFETGDFTGWSQTNNLGYNSVERGPEPQSGRFFASLGQMGGTGTLSQSLIAAVGSTIQVSFWLRNFGDPTNRSVPRLTAST